MNMCCISGIIISAVEYNFFYNSKNYIAKSNFEILNIEKYKKLKELTIKVIAFDEKADYIYRHFAQNDYVYIYGFINNKMEIVIKEIEKVCNKSVH